MFICLDLDHMRVLYKHPRHVALSWLALIECPNVTVSIFPLSWTKGIEVMEDSDLFLLYKNLFGQSYSPKLNYRKTLIKELFAGFDSLPLTDVNEFEASQQSNKIEVKDDVPYKYVHGAYRPQQMDDEWFPEGLRAVAPPVGGGGPTVQEKPSPAPAQPVQAVPVGVGLTPWGTPVQTIKPK